MEVKKKKKRTHDIVYTLKYTHIHIPCFLDPHTVLGDVEIIKNVVWL